MADNDATDRLTTQRHGYAGRGQQAAARGAILFDPTQLRQARAEWFDPVYWGARAKPVDAGGRGGAWYVQGPFGKAVLRHYLRGGLAAKLSREHYVWQGEPRVRSFAEYRLTDTLHQRGLPVARPIAASYQREGATYRAAILLERLEGVRTFAERVAADASAAPWAEAGRLIARFHQAGLDHADLNANNILFDSGGDADGEGWLIDFDRSRLRRPATTWRENNLARLLRSLQKLRGVRTRKEVEADFVRLYDAYEAAMGRIP